MPDTQPKEIYNRQPRGVPMAGSGKGGWVLAVFSLPFIAVGIGVVYASLTGAIPSQPNGFPPLVATAFGASFFIAGLMLFIQGIRSLRANSQASTQRLAGRPAWEYDFAWNPQCIQDDSSRGWLGAFFFAGFMFIFLVPFNFWAFFSKQGNFFVVIIVSIFDLINAGIFLYACYVLLRHLKYGTATLHFDRFPYVPGEPFSASFSTARSIGRFRSITFILRCIEEHQEHSDDSTKTVFRQIYADTLELKEEGVHESSGQRLPISFPLPGGDYGTGLSTRVIPRYWELEIAADTPGVDFNARFLVPVYAKSDPAETSHAGH